MGVLPAAGVGWMVASVLTGAAAVIIYRLCDQICLNPCQQICVHPRSSAVLCVWRLPCLPIGAQELWNYKT